MATPESPQMALEAEFLEYDEPVDQTGFGFSLTRRQFVQVLGAGLLIAVCQAPVEGQATTQARPARGRGRPPILGARLHLGRDGTITVLTGKVEGGQGARTELSQAAAEELRVAVSRINLVMADTGLVPDDGITAGSRSTPGTVPAVRQAAAAARKLLQESAARRWNVPVSEVGARDGQAQHVASGRHWSYAELASAEEAAEAFNQAIPADVTVTPVKEWKVMGAGAPRPNGRDLVTGAHRFPSDIVRPDMLHGKVLRPPAYGATLTDIDLSAAQAMKDVIVVRDGGFVAVAAPTTFQAEQALQSLAASAKWATKPHPSSDELFEHLRSQAQLPGNPYAEQLKAAAKALKQSYRVAYVQHAPLEPRAATAEWNEGKLTVWTASQNPFGVRGELMRAFRLGEDQVRVIIPDFGGGFGGKHSGETAVEAARLAQAARRPVALRWTRREEFTWAYFRPAALIDIEAGLDEQGTITSWHYLNINSGGAGLETPYRTGQSNCKFIQSDPPLRQGSYRALAATANNFARECFMDELAEAAGRDPLEFRLAHLDNPRLRAVLEEAAKQFNWTDRVREKQENVGVGLACGTEKGSVVAACVEIALDRQSKQITVRRVCQAFECGPILNPDNLLSQVQGCILMGLGPALREEVRFEGGKQLTADFATYRVPRFEDVPVLDIHLLNRPDLPPVGAGETPIIAVAPAIANAVWRLTGQRVRQMPVRV